MNERIVNNLRKSNINSISLFLLSEENLKNANPSPVHQFET